MPDRGAEAGQPPAKAGTRRRIASLVGRALTNRWTKWSLLGVAVVGGGVAVARQRADVGAAVTQIGAGATAAAAALVAVGLLATMQVWRTLLGGLGSPLPVTTAARIFFVGQLGKYLPGSMWPVVAQMELAHAHQVPRSRTATAAVLTMAVSLGAGLVTAAVVLAAGAGAVTERYWWALLGVPVLGLLLRPKVVNAVVGMALRVLRRPPLPQPLSGRTIVVSLAWAVASWLLLGAHAWLLSWPLTGSPGGVAALAVGGFTLAWCLGFLAVITPAGAGVRDVLLVAILGAQLSTGQATAVAVLSRGLLTAGDLVLAGVTAVAAYLAGRDPGRSL
ncbi:lysylphosphatidylglycerol synthase domain-containing protein [Dactylosporangium sp. NPDC050588]|uniref:lysylphosphatidylglycerol synthase domain-containing protein n=1 Tax=Dactylosporangium sp. NPDC050588 TaxID=3157211 RepID=UPI0033CABEB1